jgi:hypothetical protein
MDQLVLERMRIMLGISQNFIYYNAFGQVDIRRFQMERIDDDG